MLSGPAGGVVGMAEAASAVGLKRLVGFDMGGTSTDVSAYSGEYERSVDSLVGGVRLRAPMMRIHTIAAGGGSLLRYADGRFQVGPESGGRRPWTRMLSARRTIGGDRREPAAWPASAVVFSGGVRSRRRSAARYRCRQGPIRGADNSYQHRFHGRVRCGTGCGRLPRGSRREHGQRDSQNNHRTRRRRARFHPVLLRRGGRPARVPRSGGSRYSRGLDTPAGWRAVRLTGWALPTSASSTSVPSMCR